jgi:hypothetical protein
VEAAGTAPAATEPVYWNSTTPGRYVASDFSFAAIVSIDGTPPR